MRARELGAGAWAFVRTFRPRRPAVGAGRWAFVESFRAPRPTASASTTSWHGAVALREAASLYEQAQGQRLAAARAPWNKRLAELGGDPWDYDWDRFRPLRLSREEDWSDWLA